MVKPELRYTSNVELRAAKDKFEISGIAASYNRKSAPVGGQFIERIAPNAFSRALREKQDVRALFQHDPSAILGRTKSGTLQLSDSPEGLRFVCQLNERSQLHRDVYEAVKRGDLSDCSFGFMVPDSGDTWEQDPESRMRLRTLRNVDLLDVSVVTYPQYPVGTSVDARNFNREVGSIGTYGVRRIPTTEELLRKMDAYRRAELERLGRIIAREC